MYWGEEQEQEQAEPTKKVSYLQEALAVRKGLIVVILFPFLDFVDDLVKCHRVCRGFHLLIDPRSKFRVNYSSLFHKQSSRLTREAVRRFVWADSLKDVYEAWKPLHKRVYITYKNCTGQKPGNVIGDSFVSQKWWPLQREYMTNDYRLVKVAFGDNGLYIYSFQLSYSDGSTSPLLG